MTEQPFTPSESEPHVPTQAETEDLFGPSKDEIDAQAAHVAEVSAAVTEKLRAGIASALEKASQADTTSPHDEAA